MAKLTLIDITNLSNQSTSQAAINLNNTVLETALENTFSRDGTAPNQMGATLDMNSNRIINLPTSVSGTEPITRNEFLAIEAISDISALNAAIAAAQASAASAAASLASILSGLTTPRTVMTNNMNFYVRPGGLDTNTGLADTDAGAFLTLQGAYDSINKTYDANGRWIATVNIRAGTYTSGLNIFGPPLAGTPASTLNAIQFVGDTTTPSNVVISTSGLCLLATYGGSIVISGVKFTSSGNTCVYASGGGKINISGKVDFGSSAGVHMLANVNGVIVTSASAYTISGNATAHVGATRSGTVEIGLSTITLTGTPAFSIAFVYTQFGLVVFNAPTFSGSATGPRFSIDNGKVDIGGAAGGLSYLPGSTTGPIIGGGRYDIWYASTNKTKQAFTASANFTAPAATLATTVFKVTAVGPGGGGAGGSTNNVTGPGGGGGGVGIRWYTGLTAGSTYAVNIPAGGLAGTASADGATGLSSTTFAGPVSTLTATSGTGAGHFSVNGGVGGTASNADIILPGEDGGSSFGGTGSYAPGGKGGTAIGWGVGGTSGVSSNGASASGGPGKNYGGGGGGGGAGAANQSAGGAGAPGYVLVEWEL